MDPFSATLLAYTATVNLLAKIIEKAPPEAVGDLIVKHEARIDKLWNVLAKIDSGIGKLFHDSAAQETPKA